jgi:hypothetical protein
MEAGSQDLPNIDAKFSRFSAWKLNQSGELFDMKEAAFEEKPVPAEARDAGAAAARQCSTNSIRGAAR